MGPHLKSALKFLLHIFKASHCPRVRTKLSTESMTDSPKPAATDSQALGKPMQSSSIPPEWYEAQAELAAQELDFDLHLAACESEIKHGISASLEPMPQPDPQPLDNSVYNFNAILDAD